MPLLNYIPNLSVYDSLMGGGMNVWADRKIYASPETWRSGERMAKPDNTIWGQLVIAHPVVHAPGQLDLAISIS